MATATFVHDDSKLVRGLRRAEKKLKAFGASVRNFGLKLAGLPAAPLGDGLDQRAVGVAMSRTPLRLHASEPQVRSIAASFSPWCSEPFRRLTTAGTGV